MHSRPYKFIEPSGQNYRSKTVRCQSRLEDSDIKLCLDTVFALIQDELRLVARLRYKV